MTKSGVKRPVYAVIDDNQKQVASLIEAVNEFDIVTLEWAMPSSTYEEQIKYLSARKYDGVIMDLVLDDHPTDGVYPKFTSNSVVQGLRDELAFAKATKGHPVVLWSSEPLLQKHYAREFTAHDLYDLTIVKRTIASDAEKIATKLSALATGYDRIRPLRGQGRSGLLKMIGAKRRPLPIALGSHFDGNGDSAPFSEHEFARYIIKELLDQPYPLIDEALLAARLGTDKTDAAWNRLLSKFASALYTGVFSEGWQRWWWDDVVSILDEHEITVSTLRRNLAEQRVELISKAFGVKKLSPAEPIEDDYSTAFWAVCDGLHKPVDPRNAFVSTYTGKELWQEPRYLSLKAAIAGDKNHPELTVSAAERHRFEAAIAED